MKPVLSPAEVAAQVQDGARIMIGGFMGVGSPHRMIDALVARNLSDLTIIANDTAMPGYAIGKLIAAGCVSHLIVSHIGTNPQTQTRVIEEEISIELVPQGTLIERIRAGGAGLGGVLTATGLGTEVSKDKQVVTVENRAYLLETPLKADVALIAAQQADYLGNLIYTLTAQNFNPTMAMAADTVIAETNSIVPVGVISPDAVRTPGCLVDYLLERPI
ncbi:CoA transferase subunit A [Shimia aestuarii]|uniref:Acetate CoA/acetoacetate CoA-transferase alpha subunit n=1 Tax=Shimia aestuarii TaxID=254406 RepID=A0A1I4T8T8_9RHOB|nr:3-oxoacid CoA-transferase subunit A [Shimia aestuarii]SFM72990.1 acetate CoA/acetoacetate CoA-transferase alpha subunit [Shimia aestuarii]